MGVFKLIKIIITSIVLPFLRPAIDCRRCLDSYSLNVCRLHAVWNGSKSVVNFDRDVNHGVTSTTSFPLDLENVESITCRLRERKGSPSACLSGSIPRQFPTSHQWAVTVCVTTCDVAATNPGTGV